MSQKIFQSFFILLICGLSLNSCDPKPKSENNAALTLHKSQFNDLPNWKHDQHAKAIPALKKSCIRIHLQSDLSRPIKPNGLGGTYGDWTDLCTQVITLPENDNVAAKVFFETWFTPYQASADYDVTGLFTGYYEPELRGSTTQHGNFQTPLYLRPDDLIMINLGNFRDDLKGRRIAGYIEGGKLKPYANRAEIENGALEGKNLEILWVDNATDAFFLHIQGSGRIAMEDGTITRLGYAGQNGHPYFAIGRELIERGVLTKKTVSLQTIKAWLEENPSQAQDVMNLNSSYVFFRKLENSEGPLGGSGVALTAGRSLAIDRTKIPYGIPVWLQAQNPDPDKQDKMFERLLIAQDTGGAIRGAVRGDVFWGYGAKAAFKAGHMKSKGQYWLLLPKSVAVTLAPEQSYFSKLMRKFK